MHQAGIGRDALKLIATNSRGEMDGDALAQAVERDRAAGIVPVLISATAGTTGGGMIDPLTRCAEVARTLICKVQQSGVPGHADDDSSQGGACELNLPDAETDINTVMNVEPREEPGRRRRR